MEAITIEILNPKAKLLLKNLADLKLIHISKQKHTDISFEKTIARIRSKSDNKLSLDEITKEVELVRAKNYATKK